jgi:hypothetical protein
MCANGRTANGSAVTRVGGHTTVTRRLHSTRPAAALRLHSVARRSHGGRTAVARPGGRVAHPQRMRGPLACWPVLARTRAVLAPSRPQPRASARPPPPPSPPASPTESPPVAAAAAAPHCCSNAKRCLHTPQHAAGQQRVGESVGGLTVGLRPSGCAQATRGREAHRASRREKVAVVLGCPSPINVGNNNTPNSC